MNLSYCNVTADQESTAGEVPLFGNVQFHYLAEWLAAGFGLFAVLLSVFLMTMHATHYAAPLEQKYILRILFMVPIYSIVSFLSLVDYFHAVYYQVLRDCYEAFAIASFFALMCHYVAPTLHEQKDRFRQIKPKRWVVPLSIGKHQMFRTPRSGLTWFNIIWFCIFQYCVVRVFCTIMAVVAEAFGRYCIASESPMFAHVWYTALTGLAVTIAMYCLLQFYIQTKEELAPFKPGQKLLAIKGVIFLSFWQTFLLGILTSTSVGALKAGPHVAQPDITIGIPALAICFEMALFSILHVFVYPWRPYDINGPLGMQIEHQTGAKRDRYYGGPFGVKAFLDAFNPIDIVKAVGRGFRWIFVGRKHREEDISYKQGGDLAGAGSAGLGESNTLGPLSSFKVGGGTRTGKYSRLDDDSTADDDRDNIPLQPQAAVMGRTPGGLRYAEQNSYDRDGMSPPDRSTPDISRTPSPYEAYRTQRQSKDQGYRDGAPSGQMDLSGMPRPSGQFQDAPVSGLEVPRPLRAGGGTTSNVPYPPDQDTGYHGATHGANENLWNRNQF